VCPPRWTRIFAWQRFKEDWKRFGCPEIFNTDQGVQFTSEAFTSVLKCHEITISMDGKSGFLDNVFVERLWRTVSKEDIYLKAYETLRDLQQGLEAYFRFYNT
jgi:putative transposase